MTEYSDENKGVMWRPYSDQKLALQGKLDIEGNELRIVALKMPLKKDGDPVLVIYEQCGILYPNTDDSPHEKAPQYSGPLDKHSTLRVAGWTGEKDGNKYLQLKVSEKQNPGDTSGSKKRDDYPTDLDDEIPF